MFSDEESVKKLEKIIKQKKEKNKQKNPDEDRFDVMFEKYQSKLIKELQKVTEGEVGGTPFQEVDADE